MRILISTVALVACTSLANAADLGGPYGDSLKDDPYVAAAPSWTGLYVGAHVGYGWGEWDGRLATEGADSDAIWANPNKSIDGDGWLGGGQIGFNLQRGSIVFGLEADASWSDVNGSGSFVTDGTAIDDDVYTWDVDAELEYFGTVRGRLGFLPTPRLLLYATGGYAWGKTNMSMVTSHENAPQQVAPHVTGSGSISETHHGWAAGAGGEFMLTENWTGRAEWLHVDLGETSSKAIANGTDSFPADLTFDVFRVGVNYKFGH